MKKLEKTYSELIRLKTFQERFEYLRTNSKVGFETFGSRRHFNQKFYASKEWKHARDQVILRDDGCDLACPDRPIFDKVFIHHLNPITFEDVLENRKCVYDPENLICVSYETHNAIHYGDSSSVRKDLVERAPNDTCPWK